MVVKDEGKQPLTDKPVSKWQQIKESMVTPRGLCCLGTVGCLLLAAILLATINTGRAQFSFPPRKVDPRNSLHQRLMRAKNAPIIIPGGDRVTLAARSRIDAARSTDVDLTHGSLPAINLADTEVADGTVKIGNINLFYVQSRPQSNLSKNLTFLLLHGARYNADTWRKINTLRTLSALGYHAIAIDLPGSGFGASRSTGVLQESGSDFLRAVVDTFGLSQRSSSDRSENNGVVVVSPSLSGRLSMPLLREGAPWLAGFVSVAPVSSDLISPADAKAIHVPVAIVYGSRDTGLGRSSLNNLRLIPSSLPAPIPNAGHAAYLDQPRLWHVILYNFADKISTAAAAAAADAKHRMGDVKDANLRF